MRKSLSFVLINNELTFLYVYTKQNRHTKRILFWIKMSRVIKIINLSHKIITNIYNETEKQKSFPKHAYIQTINIKYILIM